MVMISNRLRAVWNRFQAGISITAVGVFKPRRWRFLLASVVGVIAVTLLATTAWAYTVTISPAVPKLGDTISVRIQSQPGMDEPPTVTMNGTTYPSYPMPGGYFRAMIPTNPLDRPGGYTVQVNGTEGARTLDLELGDRSFNTQWITIAPSQSSLGTDYEFERIGAFKQIVSPQKYWNGPMVRPSEGRISSAYGNLRYYNGVFAEDYYHRGVDYAAANGSPLYAPAAGYVRLVGRVADGFELNGNTVGIDHGQGVLSIMIHLSRIDVQEGDFVQAGQVVGTMGSTGFATGPNLHWGLYVNGVAVDPVPWRFDGVE
ncbi:MAG: M23 family metallopeptidase [Leptolyngbyaceae bacterium]|nr:M23 family metallopeptidase [Leptolyngbyaceae bacterium]